MVVCLQNHDQIGNRAFGRRLNHDIEPALFRALSALLLLLPETPLLFMGQEWAAGTPFLFFTDHHPGLGRLVTEGRRAEFAKFDAFADPDVRERIPDPQAPSTFEASRIAWDERSRMPHAGVLHLYRTLLRLRRTAVAVGPHAPFEAVALDDDCLVLTRGGGAGEPMLLLALCTGASGQADLDRWRPGAPTGHWALLLTTDDQRFHDAGAAGESTAPRIELHPRLAVSFRGPSAVILRGA
jgi:maltooligosyltrehalose trehalohydrolase